MPWFVYRDVPEGRIQRGLTRVLAAIALLFLLAFPLPAEEEKLSDDALYRSTLSIDIDTAGYYELLSWCEKLGLDTKGTRQDLAARLRGFYKLASTVESKTLPGESDEKSITVTSADSVRSFTIDLVNEKYVSFRGDVLLTLKDGKTSHSIEADSVVLNQTEKTITAFGNIRYTMEKEGRKEYFTGESLTFSVDDLSGFFYKGFSEKKQKIGEKELTFYYSGNTMYRSSGNIVTLKDGIITSCEKPEPHYSIHATKIWVLGPGEWAIKGGALYLGYVPVAYLPFFFKPGDAFFFNPSLGYRTREGYFLQTTTYLLGEKEQSASGISFLQIGDDGSTQYATEREGLFLKKTRAASHTEEQGKVKLMLDAYSRLGYFGGISAEFADRGFLEKLTLTSGVAMSRSLFTQSDGTYSPLYEFPDGSVGSIWNRSDLWKLSLPFRYGMDLSFSMRTPYLSLTGALPLYSDKYFYNDFFDRSEGMDWDTLLFSGSDSTTSSNSTLSSLTLSLNMTVTPDVSALKPYVDSLSISSLQVSMTESSKSNSSYDPEEGYFSTFYYPDTYLFPSLSLLMSGTIFSTGKKSESTPEAGGEFGKARPPAVAEGEAEDGEPPAESEGGNFRLPQPRPAFPLALSDSQERYLTQSLSYSLAPSMTLNSLMDSSDWLQPSDVDFQTSYSVLNLLGTSSLSYETGLSDGTFSLKDTMNLSANYKAHYNLSEEEKSNLETYRLADDKVSYLKLSDSLMVNLKPFYKVPSLSTSSLSYNLGFTLYDLSFDTGAGAFQDSLVSWDSDFIKIHTLDLAMNLNALSATQTLKFQAVLPPRKAEFSPSLAVKTGNLTTTAVYKVKEDDESGTWQSEPVSLTGKYDFLSKSFVQQEITYDFEESGFAYAKSQVSLKNSDEKVSFSQSFSLDLDRVKPLDAVTTLNLWAFYASFQAKETYPYTFVAGSGWSKGTELSFLPYSLSTGAKYTYTSDYLWKDRLSYSFSLDSSLAMNLVTYTDSIFNFDFSFTIHIFEFLDFTITSKSYNKAFYRYFPGFAENLGVGATSENMFVDLLKSFNFFSRMDREESSFKLQSINLSLVHNLHDWDFSLTYSGKPVLDEDAHTYEWVPSLTILLQWKPIPEMKKEITYDEDGLNF